MIPSDAKFVLAIAAASHLRNGGSIHPRPGNKELLAKLHWRTLRYVTPAVYVWEVVARIGCHRLRRSTVRYVRSLVRAGYAGPDRLRRGAHRAGRRHALRFEISQRFGQFEGDASVSQARADAALEFLEGAGLVVVDRPVLFLTPAGVACLSVDVMREAA